MNLCPCYIKVKSWLRHAYLNPTVKSSWCLSMVNEPWILLRWWNDEFFDDLKDVWIKIFVTNEDVPRVVQHSRLIRSAGDASIEYKKLLIDASYVKVIRGVLTAVFKPIVTLCYSGTNQMHLKTKRIKINSAMKNLSNFFS